MQSVAKGVLLVLALAAQQGKVPRYDWEKVPSSKVASEIEKLAEKLAPHLEGRRCLLAPFQCEEAKPAAWPFTPHFRHLFRARLVQRGTELVDEKPFLQLLNPEGKTAALPAVRYTPAIVKKAASLTGAGVVLAATCLMAPGQAKVSIVAYDGEKGTRLGDASALFGATDISPASNTPPTSRSLVQWAEKQLGKKIGQGECTHLADGALDAVKSRKPAGGYYSWGELLPAGVPFLPGDIIQFEKAAFANGRSVNHHTVIVYDVLGPGRVEVLHQNWAGGNESGRIVGFGMYEGLDGVTGGEVLVYRPIAPAK